MTDIESKQAWSFHVVVHAYGIMFSDMFLTCFCDYGLVYRVGLMQEMHPPPPDPTSTPAGTEGGT